MSSTSTVVQIYVCPACLFRGMSPALDKHGRPYLKCQTCSMFIFVRIGALGLHTVINTMLLLDRPDIMAWVRAEAYKDLAGPGQGLFALLGAPQKGAAAAAPAIDHVEAVSK